MTENAFLTDSCWLEMTPNVIRGYRNMPYVRENPDWWMLEIVDGFGSHVSSLEASQMRWNAKILLIKEEGDSSSVNQAYDKLVAKEDKRVLRATLSDIRNMKGSNNFLTQWDLVHCGLRSVQHTSERPELWSGSFDAVNLRPSTRVSFLEWCKRIEPYMTSADSFDLVTQTQKLDKYTLLPEFWQAMSKEHKQLAVDIVKKHGSSWSVACLLELMNNLLVDQKELSSLQTCIWCAIEDPTHIERGMEDIDVVNELP
jgi:hypothetical protein